MKVTSRVAYILNMAAKPSGSFVRVDAFNDYCWSFIRPYQFQRPAIENIPSEREIRKLLAAGYVKLIRSRRFGYGTQGDKRALQRAAVITDIGATALANSGLREVLP